MYGTQQPQAAVTNNRERKVLTMANQIFMRVNEVAEELGVSIPYEYPSNHRCDRCHRRGNVKKYP